MEIEADESFKKAGAIPFKWEIRPGVPKLQYSQQSTSPLSDESNPSRLIPETPRKLRPPPAASFSFQPPNPEPRTRSFRSAPRARSERHHLLTRPSMGVVASDGCFPSPLLKRTAEKKKKKKSKKTGSEPQSESEADYMSDLETVSRWSVSTRKSVSPFRDSLSSSFSSHESSPRRPVSDADWLGFALF